MRSRGARPVLVELRRCEESALPAVKKKKRPFARYKKQHQRARASALITRAVHLLEELGEDDLRVSWLLQDCVDLLAESSVGFDSPEVAVSIEALLSPELPGCMTHEEPLRPVS